MAFTDSGETIGEMCSPCLDCVNRRRYDADDPTAGPVPWGNWPAREWPTIGDLEVARFLYLEAMFPDAAAFRPGGHPPEDESSPAFALLTGDEIGRHRRG